MGLFATKDIYIYIYISILDIVCSYHKDIPKRGFPQQDQRRGAEAPLGAIQKMQKEKKMQTIIKYFKIGLVIKRANGTAHVNDSRRATILKGIATSLHKSWSTGKIVPRTPSAESFRHVYRERNKAADRLCNLAMDKQASTVWISPGRHVTITKLCAHFDGGKRGNLSAACGWNLQGCVGTDANGDAEWDTLAYGSILLDPSTTTVEAELQGLREATHAVLSWATRATIDFNGALADLRMNAST